MCVIAVYEDLKMNIVSWQHLVPFGKLLAEIARVVGALAYLDHYARDLGMEVQLAADSSDQHEQGRAGKVLTRHPELSFCVAALSLYWIDALVFVGRMARVFD